MERETKIGEVRHEGGSQNGLRDRGDGNGMIRRRREQRRKMQIDPELL